MSTLPREQAIHLRFMPLDSADKALVEKRECNCYLQLSMPAHRTFKQIYQFLCKKWAWLKDLQANRSISQTNIKGLGISIYYLDASGQSSSCLLQCFLQQSVHAVLRDALEICSTVTLMYSFSNPSTLIPVTSPYLQLHSPDISHCASNPTGISVSISPKSQSNLLSNEVKESTQQLVENPVIESMQYPQQQSPQHNRSCQLEGYGVEDSLFAALNDFVSGSSIAFLPQQSFTGDNSRNEEYTNSTDQRFEHSPSSNALGKRKKCGQEEITIPPQDERVNMEDSLLILFSDYLVEAHVGVPPPPSNTSQEVKVEDNVDPPVNTATTSSNLMKDQKSEVSILPAGSKASNDEERKRDKKTSKKKGKARVGDNVQLKTEGKFPLVETEVVPQPSSAAVVKQLRQKPHNTRKLRRIRPSFVAPAEKQQEYLSLFQGIRNLLNARATHVASDGN